MALATDVVLVAPSRRTARRRRTLVRLLTGWGFVGPATVVVLGLTLFPAGWAFVLSRQEWNGFSEPENVGWDNYARFGDDPELLSAALHTVAFTALFVPVSVILGLLIAVALNQKVRLNWFYRTAIFVPFVASAAATGILGNYVFSPEFGIANNLLRVTGLPQQRFLEDPRQAIVVIAAMALWQQLGFIVVVYLAALQDVDRSLLEASSIDGCNRVQTFRYITLPEVAPVTVFASVWQTITAIQLFDLVYTTTRGGPLNSTSTVVYYLYTKAFKELDFGYGSAIAYGLFAVTLLITLALVAYSRRANVQAF